VPASPLTGSSRSPLSPGPRTASSSGWTRGRGGRGGLASDVPPGLALALWLLAGGLAAFTILRAISPDDEGLMLQAGARIAGGQWPYRDFWTNYPPGEAVLLAALDKLFGVSMLSWRVVWVAVCATTSLLGFRLVHRETGSLGLALLAWLGVAGAVAWPSTPEPDPTAFMLALAALWVAPRRAWPAGAIAGLAVFFRLEIGGAALLGTLVMVAPGERLRALAAAVAVALASLGPFLVTAPGAMLHDTVGFFSIQAEQRLPLPISFHGPLRPDKLLEFYYPLLLLIGAGLAVLTLVVGRGRTTGRLAVALVPLGIVGVVYLLGRTDEFHLLPLSAVLAMLLACGAGTARPLPALRVVLVTGMVVIALAGLDRRAGQALHPPAAAAMPGPAGDGVQTSPADARSLRALIATVDRLTRPGQPIFVADPRFDEVRVGDPLLYLTLNRPNPTRYDVMQPGLVTTAPVQRQIIRSLQRSHTRVIIRWLNPTADSPQPGAAGASSGVHLLDRFIAAHYRVDVTHGYYRVLVAR
jgi:hypothetical protein